MEQEWIDNMPSRPDVVQEFRSITDGIRALIQQQEEAVFKRSHKAIFVGLTPRTPLEACQIVVQLLM